jgi:ribosomal protein S13
LSDLWAALEITLELTKALKANGITSATAKAMQDELGVKELSDIQDLGEEELQRLERQGAKSSKFRP